MTDCYIYDAVRTPRGRGKKDGALHEVTALELATQALQAIRDRNHLDTSQARRRDHGLRRSGGRAGRRHRARRRAEGGLRPDRAGRADQPLLRERARGLQHGGGPDHGRPVRSRDRRRRRGDEPGADRLLGRRLAGGSLDRHSRLFRAAGDFRRSHRDARRLFARRCRCVRGRKPEARRERVEQGLLQELGHRRSRTPSARPSSTATSTCGPTRRCSRWRRSSPPLPNSARWVSTRSRSSAIRRWKRSITCITPAIRRASSTARRPCCSAQRRWARRSA